MRASGEPARRLTRDATLTAFVISSICLVAGRLLLALFGITENDFRVGGGIVLLVLSVYDLLFSHGAERMPSPAVGVVPLGIPLIMGPAALTTIVYPVNSYGVLLANMLLLWGVSRGRTGD